MFHSHHCKRHLKKRTVALDPLPPPAYAVYARENDDNYGRPLTHNQQSVCFSTVTKQTMYSLWRRHSTTWVRERCIKKECAYGAILTSQLPARGAWLKSSYTFRNVIAKARPDATGPNPEATGLNPEATGLNPEATGLNPEATRLNPEATGLSHEATGLSPEATGPSPEATGLSPEETGLSPEVTGLSPEVTGSSPEATGLSPEVTGLSPEANGISHEANGISHEATGANTGYCSDANK